MPKNKTTQKNPTPSTPSDDDIKLAAAIKAQSEGSVIAGAGIRLLGVVYDGMLVLAMLFLMALICISIGTVLFGEVGTSAADAKDLPTWYKNLVLMPSFVLTLVGFYGLFWGKSGQTLGMQTLRLKTVNSDGKLLTWGQSTVRILCACVVPFVCGGLGYLLYARAGFVISLMFGFMLNYLFCLVNRRGLAVHDWLSNTLTLRIPKTVHNTLWQSIKAKQNSN